MYLARVLLACSLLAGCYESHSLFGSIERDSGPFPGRDGGPFPRPDGAPFPFDSGPFFPDAGPFPFDGGPPRLDAGPRDAGPVSDAGPRPDAGRRDAGRPRDAGPPLDAGRRSIALRFDRGDLLVVADAASLDLVRAHTLEMWIRPRPGGLTSGSVAIKGNRETDRFMYGIAISGDDLLLGWGRVGDRHELRVPFTRGVWTHVAMIVETVGSTARLTAMLDGVVVATATFPNDIADSVNDAPLTFGQGYEGDIDEIRLWRFARRPDGVRSTMRTRVPAGLPGLEGYWPLEERGQLALDHTLLGHDAVLGTLTTPDPSDPVWIFDGAI